jgi:hypothetical protein
LAVSARELAEYATSVEERLGRLNKLNKIWQATLQSAKQPETPAKVLKSVQSIVDYLSFEVKDALARENIAIA